MKLKKNHFSAFKVFWNITILLLLGTAFLYVSSCKSSREPAPDKQKALVSYKASNVRGYKGKPIIVDYYFINSMNRINSYAKRNNLTLFVTSSFRKADQKVNGAIVPPARHSNHLVGHAIDMNIQYNGTWYDSKLMRKENLKNLPHNVQNFFHRIRKDKTLRWGGDFTTQDPVHIDDHLNKNHRVWLARFNVVQKT